MASISETSQELKYKILLNLIEEIGSIRANNLLRYFGTAEKIFNSNLQELKAVEDIGDYLAKKIILAKNKIEDAEKEIDLAQKLNIKIYEINHPQYPSILKTIPDPPPVIYIKGELKDEDIQAVSIVGTRRPTNYGRSVTQYLSQQLAKMKVTIISGLARGIDTEAHKSALKAKGRTIAVLGNGLSVYYPPENRKLQDEIAENGAVISEFPLRSQPDKGNFPRRNRLISALSLGVVIVEADEKSGALITAKHAIEQGKDVFAVPGSIFSRFSKGPHLLIKQGAKLIENVNDIVDEIASLSKWLSIKQEKTVKQNEIPGILTEAEQKVIDIISSEPLGVHIDKIQGILNMPFGELSSILVTLELKGLLRSLPGKMYMKVNGSQSN